MPDDKRLCPRCGEYIEGYPALSRTDSKTDICSLCGQDEAMIEYQYGIVLPQDKWHSSTPF